MLCNALWYVTNKHDTINEESSRKSVLAIPKFFKKYQNYNDTKRKKMKCIKLSANSLESHSQALYSILLKPVIKSSPSWCRLHDDMKALVDCLSHYKDFLNKKAKEIGNNHNLLHPVRTVGEFTSVEHRRSCRPCDLDKRYTLLDVALREGSGDFHVFSMKKNTWSIHFKAIFRDTDSSQNYI